MTAPGPGPSRCGRCAASSAGWPTSCFPGPVPEGQTLRADADMWFRFGQRTLKLENGFIHAGGEDLAMGRILLDRNRKKDEPRFIKVSRDQMINGLMDSYQKAAARAQ
jgi:hypothetical protein